MSRTEIHSSFLNGYLIPAIFDSVLIWNQISVPNSIQNQKYVYFVLTQSVE